MFSATTCAPCAQKLLILYAVGSSKYRKKRARYDALFVHTEHEMVKLWCYVTFSAMWGEAARRVTQRTGGFESCRYSCCIIIATRRSHSKQQLNENYFVDAIGAIQVAFVFWLQASEFSESSEDEMLLILKVQMGTGKAWLGACWALFTVLRVQCQLFWRKLAIELVSFTFMYCLCHLHFFFFLDVSFPARSPLPLASVFYWILAELRLLQHLPVLWARRTELILGEFFYPMHLFVGGVVKTSGIVPLPALRARKGRSISPPPSQIPRNAFETLCALPFLSCGVEWFFLEVRFFF